jgi:hypothetical protein
MPTKGGNVARPRNPMADIKKCERNIGKDVRLTMRSGTIIEGTIWSIFYPVYKDGKSIGIHVRVWDSGLASKNRHGLPSGLVIPVHARFVAKFEYLWESAESTEGG